MSLAKVGSPEPHDEPHRLAMAPGRGQRGASSSAVSCSVVHDGVGSNAGDLHRRRSADGSAPGSAVAVGGSIGGHRPDVTAGARQKAGASTPYRHGRPPAFSERKEQWRSSCKKYGGSSVGDAERSGASPSASWRPRRPATTSSWWSPRWVTPPTTCSTWPGRCPLAPRRASWTCC